MVPVTVWKADLDNELMLLEEAVEKKPFSSMLTYQLPLANTTKRAELRKEWQVCEQQ